MIKSSATSAPAAWAKSSRARQQAPARSRLESPAKAFAQDPERLARFRREAQVLAQLNHVNIAAIYNVEQSGETHFLVMELALGETLRDRVKGHREQGTGRRDSARGSPRHLQADRRGPRMRAREAHRAPRSQAREH
ncbi:MAG: protein kinase [Terriglobia bacterium]